MSEANGRKVEARDGRDCQADITFIFATILRPDCARRLIASIRRHYPAMKILVADQNPFDPDMAAFYRDNGVTAKYLPFDTGVSASRASLIDMIDTRYTLFGDDDLIFTDRTDPGPARAFLDAHDRIGIVGGSMTDHVPGRDGRHVMVRRRYEKIIRMIPEQRGMITVPIDYVMPRTTVFDGRHFLHCDMVLNWALCRTEILRNPALRWDGQFKIGGEHEDFFMQIKARSDWGVVYCPQLTCEHRHQGSATYEALRARSEGWAGLGRKWNLDWVLDIGTGLRRFDDFPRLLPYTATQSPGADQMPAIRRDYLRLWHDGHAGASVSPTERLHRERQQAGNAKAALQRRVQTLQARIAQLTAHNEKAAARIKTLTQQNESLRDRMAMTPTATDPAPEGRAE